MRVSIIIPVYNVEKYIAACLDSILSQTINSKEYEVIVVDDGSTDTCLNILKKYQQENEQISVFSQENAGVGAARNKGIELAKGDYIYFLDPDDYLAADNCLQIMLDEIEAKDLDILCFKSKSTTSYGLFGRIEAKDISSQEIYDGISFIAHTKYKNEVWWYLIKRSFLEKTGVTFILGRWMEDAIFTAQLFVKAQKMAFLPIALHWHVIVPNSAMTSKEPEHYAKVIYDNANAAVVYNNLITEIKKNERNEASITRLETRKESFVFFLIIRAFKSKLTYTDLYHILQKMRKVDAYPFKKLVGPDYNGLSYFCLTLIFNNKWLLKAAFKSFRLLKRVF